MTQNCLQCQLQLANKSCQLWRILRLSLDSHRNPCHEQGRRTKCRDWGSGKCGPSEHEVRPHGAALHTTHGQMQMTKSRVGQQSASWCRMFWRQTLKGMQNQRQFQGSIYTELKKYTSAWEQSHLCVFKVIASHFLFHNCLSALKHETICPVLAN